MGDSSPAKDVSFDSKSMNLLLDLENVGDHVLFENNEKEKPYLEKRANLNRLIKRIYENKTPFQCKACDEKFSDKASLRAHITSVHQGIKLFKITDSDISKRFHCTTCGNRFSQKHSLISHMLKVHNQLRPYKCTVCDASFEKNAELKIHKATVHEKKKSYKCKLCDSIFDEKHNLKIHICLGRKDGLNQPVESVHENKKPAKSGIKCSRCDDSFLDQKALRDHFAEQHPKLYNTIPKRL